MVLKLKWSKRATASFNHIEAFLLNEWGEGSVRSFVVKLSRVNQLLKQFPRLGQLQDQPGLRAIVVILQIILFYRVAPGYIILVDIFDTRRNPDTMKD